MLEDSFQELQRKDQIDELLAILDTDFPHSLHYTMFIKVLQAWKVQDPTLVVQILVPNPRDLRDGTSLAIFAMSLTGPKCYMAYSLQPSCENLKKALLSTNRIDWTTTDYEWEGIHEKHMPVLREVLERKQCDGQYLPHYQYYMPMEEALDMEVREQPNVKIIRLTEKHAHLVDDHWEHQTRDSFPYIKACIQLSFGFGVSSGNHAEPISWVAQTHYGGVGMLYTLEKHRKRGYGEMLVRKITKHMAELNEIPSVVVGSNNTASIRLNEKIGYRRVCKIYWVLGEGH